MDLNDSKKKFEEMKNLFSKFVGVANEINGSTKLLY